MNKPYPPIPLKKALLWIVLSTCIVSGSSLFALLYYRHLRDLQHHDPKYQIVALVQSCPDKERLKTVYLAELLDLSIDHPKNLYRFSSKEAKELLLLCPLIKQATIRKIKPGTIWVDYSLRKPIAFLGDVSNTVLDSEGIGFPFNPFFTPKKLPELYLGSLIGEGNEEINAEQGFKWGTRLKGKRIELALSLLELISLQCCSKSTQLLRIDVSKAFSPSYGQRQIVVELEDRYEKEIDGRHLLCLYPRILRLSTDNYVEQLQYYLVLQQYLFKQENQLPGPYKDKSVIQTKATIIDLRLPELAFFSHEP